MTNTTKNQLTIQLEKAVEALKNAKQAYSCNDGMFDEIAYNAIETDMKPITDFCENFLREVPRLKEFGELLDESAKEYFEQLEEWLSHRNDLDARPPYPNKKLLLSAKPLNNYNNKDLAKLFLIWSAAKLLHPLFLYKHTVERYGPEKGDFYEYYEFVHTPDFNSWEERKTFLNRVKVFKRFTFA